MLKNKNYNLLNKISYLFRKIKIMYIKMEKIQEENEKLYDKKNVLIEMKINNNVSMLTIYSIIQSKFSEINRAIEKQQSYELYVDENGILYYLNQSNIQMIAKLYDFTNILFKIDYLKNNKKVSLLCEREYYKLYFKHNNNKDEEFDIICREAIS